MKRIVVLCDGTWSKVEQSRPTNIAALKKRIPAVAADGVQQVVGYDEGVGVGGKRVSQLLGGAFGWGLSQNVRDGYTHVLDHYEPDDDVYLFGYSRGAYTARSLAGLIRNVGVLRPEHRGRLKEAYELYRDDSPSTHPDAPASVEFRRNYSHPEFGVRFIGVFDTVGSLGLPGLDAGIVQRFNKKWAFHDTKLSSTVKSAFHAVAIDEQRKTFAPTLWTLPSDGPGQVVEQVWFAGGHSNVGGGHEDPGLSTITLKWMVAKAVSQGLQVDLGELVRDPRGGLNVGRVNFFFKLWKALDRPIATSRTPEQAVASTAKLRFEDQELGYRPPKLEPALRGGIDIVDVG